MFPPRDWDRRMGSSLFPASGQVPRIFQDQGAAKNPPNAKTPGPRPQRPPPGRPNGRPLRVSRAAKIGQSIQAAACKPFHKVFRQPSLPKKGLRLSHPQCDETGSKPGLLRRYLGSFTRKEGPRGFTLARISKPGRLAGGQSDFTPLSFNRTPEGRLLTTVIAGAVTFPPCFDAKNQPGGDE